MKTRLSLLCAMICFVILEGCKKENVNPDPNPDTNPVLPIVVNGPEGDTSIVYDIDSNVYHAISIGNQIWMNENLKTSHYANGDPIPNIAVMSIAWGSLNYGACSNFVNAPDYYNEYGYLYNYLAVVDSRKLCPPGWHVPTDSEWSDLINYLGGQSVAGGKIKESDTLHWKSPNVASNSSLFTALPGGIRVGSTTCIIYGGLNRQAFFWSSTAYDGSHGWMRSLNNGSGSIPRNKSGNHDGLSVRCIKD